MQYPPTPWELLRVTLALVEHEKKGPRLCRQERVLAPSNLGSSSGIFLRNKLMPSFPPFDLLLSNSFVAHDSSLFFYLLFCFFCGKVHGGNLQELCISQHIPLGSEHHLREPMSNH